MAPAMVRSPSMPVRRCFSATALVSIAILFICARLRELKSRDLVPRLLSELRSERADPEGCSAEAFGKELRQRCAGNNSGKKLRSSIVGDGTWTHLRGGLFGFSGGKSGGQKAQKSNQGDDKMTLSRKAFDAACKEMGFSGDNSNKLWTKLHEQCFLNGGEHITVGVTAPREDARNVNAWHWDNANLLPWAKERLKTLMVGLAVPGLPDRGWLKIKELSKCEGDCETNTRKGKVMVCFDMKVVLKYEGEVNFEEIGGEISMPYIDNIETEDDNIRVEASYKRNKNAPTASAGVRNIVDERLVPLVQAQMRQFIKELHLKAKAFPEEIKAQHEAMATKERLAQSQPVDTRID